MIIVTVLCLLGIKGAMARVFMANASSITSSMPSLVTAPPTTVAPNTCSFYNSTAGWYQWNDPWCSVQAGTVQLTYWPTNNQTYPSTIYDASLDYTFTSPSVYMVINTIYGYNRCGPLGPSTKNAIFAFDLTDVSTLVPYSDETATSRRRTRQLYLSDLATNCQASYDVATLTTMTHPLKDDDTRCNPSLVIPIAIKSYGAPYWWHCGNVDNKFGLFDPPYAVSTVDGGLLGPASSTAPPVQSYTPSSAPHPVSTAAPTTPTPTAAPSIAKTSEGLKLPSLAMSVGEIHPSLPALALPTSSTASIPPPDPSPVINTPSHTSSSANIIPTAAVSRTPSDDPKNPDSTSHIHPTKDAGDSPGSTVEESRPTPDTTLEGTATRVTDQGQLDTSVTSSKKYAASTSPVAVAVDTETGVETTGISSPVASISSPATGAAKPSHTVAFGSSGLTVTSPDSVPTTPDPTVVHTEVASLGPSGLVVVHDGISTTTSLLPIASAPDSASIIQTISHPTVATYQGHTLTLGGSGVTVTSSSSGSTTPLVAHTEVASLGPGGVVVVDDRTDSTSTYAVLAGDDTTSLVSVVTYQGHILTAGGEAATVTLTSAHTKSSGADIAVKSSTTIEATQVMSLGSSGVVIVESSAGGKSTTTATVAVSTAASATVATYQGHTLTLGGGGVTLTSARATVISDSGGSSIDSSQVGYTDTATRPETTASNIAATATVNGTVSTHSSPSVVTPSVVTPSVVTATASHLGGSVILGLLNFFLVWALSA